MVLASTAATSQARWVRSAVNILEREPVNQFSGFDLLRQEMLQQYGASQVWLVMADGTRIDCCYITSTLDE